MGWVGGIGQVLTFAYMLGGWVKANAYVSKRKFQDCRFETGEVDISTLGRAFLCYFTRLVSGIPQKYYRLDHRKGPKSSEHCTKKSSELFYDL